jgi:hypothetical protein
MLSRFWKSNTSVLHANPNIVCGDSMHNSLVGISVPMFFLNVALLPCGTLAVLVFGKKKRAHFDSRLKLRMHHC